MQLWTYKECSLIKICKKICHLPDENYVKLANHLNINIVIIMIKIIIPS